MFKKFSALKGTTDSYLNRSKETLSSPPSIYLYETTTVQINQHEAALQIHQHPSTSNYRNQALAASFGSSPAPKHHVICARLSRCGETLERLDIKTGEVFRNTYQCRARYCPRCQLLKQKRSSREAKLWLQQLVHSCNLRYIYLTIGFKNVTVDSAREMMQAISLGHRNLLRTNGWPWLGSITSREFVIAEDGLIHFDTHSLIAMPLSYSGNSRDYRGQAEWNDLVQQKFKLDYRPRVYLKTVSGLNEGELLESLTRIFAYGIKPQDFATMPSIGVQLADQLHGIRRLTLTGIFKKTKHDFKQKSAKRKEAKR